MAIKNFIDQGHNPAGYHNTGASWYGVDEQDVTYQVGLYLAEMLNSDPRLKRACPDPRHPPCWAQITTPASPSGSRLANQWPAIFHQRTCHAKHEHTAANGTEVYVITFIPRPHWLAKQSWTGLWKRWAQRTRRAVKSHTLCPEKHPYARHSGGDGVLIEPG